MPPQYTQTAVTSSAGFGYASDLRVDRHRFTARRSRKSSKRAQQSAISRMQASLHVTLERKQPSTAMAGVRWKTTRRRDDERDLRRCVEETTRLIGGCWKHVGGGGSGQRLDCAGQYSLRDARCGRTADCQRAGAVRGRRGGGRWQPCGITARRFVRGSLGAPETVPVIPAILDPRVAEA